MWSPHTMGFYDSKMTRAATSDPSLRSRRPQDVRPIDQDGRSFDPARLFDHSQWCCTPSTTRQCTSQPRGSRSSVRYGFRWVPGTVEQSVWRYHHSNQWHHPSDCTSNCLDHSNYHHCEYSHFRDSHHESLLFICQIVLFEQDCCWELFRQSKHSCGFCFFCENNRRQLICGFCENNWQQLTCGSVVQQDTSICFCCLWFVASSICQACVELSSFRKWC